MSRIVALVVLVAGLAPPSPAWADEPHLEFARALRARGMSDLAVDYLQRLSAQPPPGLAAVLSLELARARLDLAAQENDPRRRDTQFRAARAALEQFLRANPRHPKAAEAQCELARMISLQGRRLLDQARRLESKAAQRDQIARARPLFTEAAGKFREAVAAIDAQPQQPGSPADKKELAQLRLQARLDEGVNLIYQAITLVESRDVRLRVDLLKKAADALTALTREDADSPAAWQARVWLGRVAEEEDNRAAARQAYETVAGEKSAAAQEAARTAAYLLLRMQAREDVVPGRPGSAQQVIAGCEDWLKRHRDAVNSPEGQGVRFVLATLLQDQGMAGVVRPSQPGVPPRVSGAPRQTLVRAQRLFKELADTDNDFTERARDRRAGILFVLTAERARDMNQLATFDDCYVAAQVEAFELNQGPKPPADRARRQARVIAALRRALELAGRGDSPRDVADARVMLVYAYMVNNQPYAAAVLGEHLGRSGDAGARSPDAVAYALQAYATIIAEGHARNASEDEARADQRRLRSLAEYMEATWPDETVTDIARHQLGNFLLDDGNYAEAFAMLSRIASTYLGLAQARYQEGVAAQRLQSPRVDLPAVRKKAILRQAIADLERVPEPEPDTGEESTLSSCLARLQLGNLLLLDDAADERNYDRVEALGKSIADLVPALTLDDKFVPQVTAEAVKLQTAGVQGRAYLLLNAGKIAEAQHVLAPLVERIRKELADPKPGDVYEPLREAQRQVLLVALRAAILENKTDQARQTLELLQKATPAVGLDSANDRLLRVVRDLKRDADAFKAKGETVRRDRLEKGLTALLDELARPKQLSPDVRVFLAQAFSGADRHDRAAELLKDMPVPKPDDEDATRLYQHARLVLAREYRLGKKFTQAKQVLDEALASWGRNNLDLRKEVVALLEDNGSFAPAVQMCRDVQKSLERSRVDYERAVTAEKAAEQAERGAKTDAERAKARSDRAEAQEAKAKAQPLREAYWEFYFYEVRAVVKSDLARAKDAADKEQRLASIARAIKRLEDGQEDFGGSDLKQRYRELVEGEPVLKRLYREAGGRRLNSDAAP
jgi:hypothetical protein